jgi:hypothetical protein
MKQHFTRLRWGLILLIIFLAAIFQLLLQENGSAGGACVRSLTEPEQEAQAFSEWTGIGYPLQYLSITEEGCFENRTTLFEWRPGAILVDVLIFVCVGLIVYSVTMWYLRQKNRAASTRRDH